MNTPAPSGSGMPQWLKVVIGILAIIGGFTVLFAAACFGMILLN